MIINCKQIILILALFILTSCKNYVISKKDIDLVKNNEKALVVSVSRISTYSNKDYLPAYIVWKNTGQKNIHRTLWVTDPKNYLEGYSLCSYILEPGEYNIKEIISMKNDFFSDTTISTYYVAGLAKFSIKGGEVIY
ncbi:hypothetical protein [Rickettsia endosymbiont of Polydrusus tereticollis]|uniref:hypothetical protein n=1 Tax=Rickettsia endosymbiont of Polydrusus tereticollis TaxID=3066251 RepID=UPI003132C8E7